MEVLPKQVFLLFVLISVQDVCISWKQDSDFSKNVVKFSMDSVLNEQTGDLEGILPGIVQSRRKRDVSESSVCRDQEQKFLQDAVKPETGFINEVLCSYVESTVNSICLSTRCHRSAFWMKPVAHSSQNLGCLAGCVKSIISWGQQQTDFICQIYVDYADNQMKYVMLWKRMFANPRQLSWICVVDRKFFKKCRLSPANVPFCSEILTWIPTFWKELDALPSRDEPTGADAQ